MIDSFSLEVEDVLEQQKQRRAFTMENIEGMSTSSLSPVFFVH